MVLRWTAPAVVAVAMIYCDPTGGSPASPVDFELLCYEFHGLPMFPRSGSAEARAEEGRALLALRHLPSNSLLNRIPDDDVEAVRALWEVGRFLDWSVRAHSIEPTDILRACAVHREFENLLTADQLQHLRSAERMVIGMDLDRFVVVALMLWELAFESNDVKGACPGRVDLEGRGHAPARYRSVELTIDDYKLAASRLGIKASSLHEMQDQLARCDDFAGSRSGWVWVLEERPVLQLDDYPEQDMSISVPSPAHFLAGCEAYISGELIRALAQNRAFDRKAQFDAYSIQGEAFHRYLEKALTGIPRLIAVDPNAGPGRKPDFLWVGDVFGIVIEAKVRVMPRQDPHHESITSAIETWHRAAESIQQGSEFLASPSAASFLAGAGLRDPGTWALVTVVHEPGTATLTAFRHVAARWKLLERSKLSGLGMMSTRELEQAVYQSDPDSVGRLITLYWIIAGDDALNQPPTEVFGREEFVAPQVAALWSELIPNAPAPWRVGSQ